MEKETLKHKVGYNFAFKEGVCEGCGGRCCTGESGYIWISVEEALLLSEYLGLKMEEFAYRYLISVSGKLNIREKQLDDGYACIFFDDQNKNCTVYEYRPIQCRTFPFWDYYKQNIEEAFRECPALVRL